MDGATPPGEDRGVEILRCALGALALLAGSAFVRVGVLLDLVL